MRVALHPCYILHQRPYRESSLIAETFSREFGRLSIVARGARRGRNPRRALLQPLRRLNMAWVARREMGTLTDVESAGPAPTLPGARIIAAFYLNELLIRLLHRHESHPELFDAYEAALAGLALADSDSEAVLRIFEKRLLTALGYGMVLDHDVISGEPLDAGRNYYFLPDRGPAATETGELRVSGATLFALEREQFSDPGQMAEAKRLMRYLLAPHLGPRPLGSRTLYRRYLDSRPAG